MCLRVNKFVWFPLWVSTELHSGDPGVMKLVSNPATSVESEFQPQHEKFPNYKKSINK